MEANVILVIITAIAILGKATSVAIATCFLLMVNLMSMQKYIYPFMESNGLNIGIIILISTILIPIAKGSITLFNIKTVIISVIGIMALIVSFLTTYLSGQGLQYLTQGHADVMPAMIVGAVLASAFLGGVPVGPLITSGLLAVILKLFHR